MQRVLLKELRFNNRKIFFNEGENYIIGPNSSGKTTLFYLIQYILGLKKSMPNLISPFSPFFTDNISLDITFGNKLIHATRLLGTDNILFEGDINTKVKASSPTIDDIYNELLQPNIDKDEDRTAAIEILKASFWGEKSLHPFRDSSNIVKKILGINISLPIQISKEIDKFKKEIELEKSTRLVLQNYLHSVESVLKSEGISKPEDTEYVVNVLNKQFTIFCNEAIQNTRILEDAKSSLNKVISHNEELFIERTKLLEPCFYRLLSEFGSLNTITIGNVFNSVESLKYSVGENTLIKLATYITLCRVSEFNWHNSSGVLVNDFAPHMLDRYRVDHYRKVISDECSSGTLQYIEFGYDKKSVPHDSIVLELNGRGL